MNTTKTTPSLESGKIQHCLELTALHDETCDLCAVAADHCRLALDVEEDGIIILIWIKRLRKVSLSPFQRLQGPRRASSPDRRLTVHIELEHGPWGNMHPG